jgi:glycosyltransferase involved in cell wall biosynthesis
LADAQRGGDLEIVLVAHGSDVRLLSRLPNVCLRWALHHLARRGATLRFVSSELRAELLAVPDLSRPTRSWLEQCPVEPAAFELPPLPPRDELRRRFAVEDGARLLVVVGRLVAAKRIDVAVAAALLVPQGRVVVLGAGPEAERLARRFPEAEFLGERPRDEALAWLRAADVVVSASRTEGAPTVVREARALRTPVVSPAVGDTRAWAEHDDELWLLEP